MTTQLTVDTAVINGTTVRSGTGTPEAAVTGIVGDLYLRKNGSAGTVLYIKESGSGNTGWVAYGVGAPDLTTATGDLDVSHLDGGTDADDTHFWRGDGVWAEPTHPAADLTTATGNLAVSHLNSGTNADNTRYWRGDGSWSLPPGSGGSPDLSSAVNDLPVANLDGGTGASSATFWRGDGSWAVPESSILEAQVTLTDAQIKATFGTPQTIVAAPGAGKILVPIAMTLVSLFAAGAYVGGGNVNLYYDSSSQALLNSISGVMGSATDRTITVPLLSTAVSQTYAATFDKALVFKNPTANFTGGNGANTLTIILQYRVVTV